MQALLFNFAKRKNSTKVPADSAGTQVDLYLKQDTSLRNPTFVLSMASVPYNYVKFEGKYFFVADKISHKNGLWYLVCEPDDLGTLRSEILASSAYVLYDNVGNSEIVDTRLAVETSSTVQKNYVAFPGYDGNGMYIMGITGEASTALWAVSSPSAIQFSTLLTNALNGSKLDPNDPNDPIDMTTFEGCLEFIGKQLWKTGSHVLSSGNALEAIRSCIWVPFPQSTVFGTPNKPIYLGNYDTGATGKRIGSFPLVHLTTVSVNIPWQFSDWRRNAPYTQLYCHIPFIGTINLAPAQLSGATSLMFDIGLNVANGDLCVDIMDNNQSFVGSYGGNCGVEILIGNSNAIQKGLTNTIIGAAASGVGAALGLGVGSAALTGIAVNAANQLAGNPTTIGGLSGGPGSMLTMNISVYTVCHDTAVSPSSVVNAIGLPSFAYKLLSTVSGYIQTSQFSLEAAAEGPAIEAVNNYLNGGCFIE